MSKKLKILNCLPDEVAIIHNGEKTVIPIFEDIEDVTRTKPNYSVKETLETSFGPVPILAPESWETQNLPAARAGCIFLVHPMVAAAHQDRKDLFILGPAVMSSRNGKKKELRGYRGLMRPHYGTL
jgi:hypothetical protein